MAAFLDRFHSLVEEVWEPGYYHTTNSYAETMRAIEDYDLRHTQPTSGAVRFTGNLQITVLAPGVGLRGRFDSYGVEINNASIALKLDFPASRVIQRREDRTYVKLPSSKSLILGADAQTLSWSQALVDFPQLGPQRTAASQALRAARGTAPLQADVFKVPHHGSKHGLNLELVEAISPNLSLISSVAGGGNTTSPMTLPRRRSARASRRWRAGAQGSGAPTTSSASTTPARARTPDRPWVRSPSSSARAGVGGCGGSWIAPPIGSTWPGAASSLEARAVAQEQGWYGLRPQAEVRALADRLKPSASVVAQNSRAAVRVLDVEDRLAGLDERLQHLALVVGEALLVDREVEVAIQVLDLAQVVLEPDREPVAVGDPRQAAVVGELVAVGHLPAGHLAAALVRRRRRRTRPRRTRPARTWRSAGPSSAAGSAAAPRRRRSPSARPETASRTACRAATCRAAMPALEPVEVGPVVLDPAGVDVTDRVAAARVHGADPAAVRMPVDGAAAAVAVQVEVVDQRAQAPAAAARPPADADVDPAGVEAALGDRLQLVLPARVGRRLDPGAGRDRGRRQRPDREKTPRAPASRPRLQVGADAARELDLHLGIAAEPRGDRTQQRRDRIAAGRRRRLDLGLDLVGEPAAAGRGTRRSPRPPWSGSGRYRAARRRGRGSSRSSAR